MDNFNAVLSNSRGEKRTGSQLENQLPSKRRNLLEPEPESNEPNQEATQIHALPVEMMGELFSYLKPTDLLAARTACTTWNNIIMTKPLINRLSFTVQRSSNPKVDSYNTLQSSDVPWKTVQIDNYISSLYPGWDFPATLNTSLTSLRINECRVTLPWIMSVTSQLQSLEKLKIRNTFLERPNEVMGEVVPSTSTVPKRPLKLELELETVSATFLCLEQFIKNKEVFNLTSLEVWFPTKVPWHCVEATRSEWSQKIVGVTGISAILHFRGWKSES